MTLVLDRDSQAMTASFCDTLDGPRTSFAWRVIPRDGRPRMLDGTLEEVWPHLAELNREGAGVFVLVNEADGHGQRSGNVVRVRAVFADLDGAPLDPILEADLPPQLIVESSPGKYHAYWLVEDCSLERFRAVQQAIAQRFDSDPAVCDLPRVMRVPGFYHQKAEPYLTRVFERNDAPPYRLAEVVEGLGLSESLDDSEPPARQKPRLDITRQLGDGERTAALTELCGRYIRLGLDDDTILMTLRGWNAHQCDPPLPDDKLVSTLASIRRCDERNRTDSDPVVADFNRDHAVVALGGKTAVIRETPDGVDYMSFNSFREFYSNLPQVEGTAAASYWLAHPDRRTYQRVVFAPGGGAANDEYNLWRGFAVDPAEGDCSLYLAHIRDNIASGDERMYSYLLDWMADAVQNPRRLPGVAIALRGRQGTGKGVFATQFGELFGRHFKHVQTADQLTGRFTQHLADASVVFADEVVWGGDKQREGVLKTLVTEKRRFIEPKGKDAFPVDNHIRLLMATNETWAVPAGMEERRFCVIDVGDARMQDAGYFDAISRQMENGGKAALLHILLNRDISNANIRAFPRTAALLDQKERSLGSVPRWWLECLRRGGIGAGASHWPEWMPTEDLWLAYTFETANEKYVRGRAGTRSELARELLKVAPLTRSRRQTGDGTGSRAHGYTLPSLAECRQRFEECIGQPVDWEE